MSELERVLADAENLAQRVAAQAEQEAAMRQTLPLRFEANMAAFRQLMPAIARRFESYQVQRPFEFFCTENGIPNLRWLDEKTAFYGADPYAESLQQVESVLGDNTLIRFNQEQEGDWIGQQHVLFMNQLVARQKELIQSHEPLAQIPESMPLGLVFGCGLGYHLSYLYERCRLANLYLFEPNEDLFYASLFTFDWQPLLDYLMSQNMGMHIFLGQSEEEIMHDIHEVVLKRSPFLCATTFGIIHYRSEELQSLQARVAKEFFTLGMGWGFFDDTLFSLAHSLSNMEAGVRFFLQGKSLPAPWADCPVFVIANGPSLDGCIDLIRRYQDKALIVACGTAITALHKAGIQPDIYAAVERITPVPGSLRQLNDPGYLQDILLLGPDVLHPECRDLFRDKIYGFKAEEPMCQLLWVNTELMAVYRTIAHTNPLVGNIGVSLPLHLGFKNLYLMGLDNGFKSSEHHHSRYSMYYSETGETRNEFKQMALAQGDSVLPGNFGGEVISNQLFACSVMMLGVALEKFPEAQCHNCSDGAAIPGAVPLAPSAIDLQQAPVIDKQALRAHLLQEMSAPVPVRRAEIERYMDVEFFNILLNKIKDEWQQPLASRFDLVQRMQTQMEYLYQVSASRQRHINNVLFGSFNSIFTLVTALAYQIKDEEAALAAVGDLTPILDEFFTTMMKLYAHGLEMIQASHHHLLTRD